MATLLTTRHWGSDESFNSFSKSFVSKFLKSQENSSNNEKLLPPAKDQSEENCARQAKPKSTNATSKIARSKVNKGCNEIFLEPSHVKASALLYEITERTNQLAQPRVRNVEERRNSQARASSSQIPRASPRIIELSKPRIPCQYPTKPVGYVARGALTAVATQRIIELSKPKKKRRWTVLRRKKTKLHPNKSRTRSHAKRVRRKRKQRGGRFFAKSKKHQSTVKKSSSDRSIIMVGMKLRNEKRSRRL